MAVIVSKCRDEFEIYIRANSEPFKQEKNYEYLDLVKGYTPDIYTNICSSNCQYRKHTRSNCRSLEQYMSMTTYQQKKSSKSKNGNLLKT